MSDRQPYSRVYWSIHADTKFDGIREDVRHIGSWTILLTLADMAWPSVAYVPPSIPVDSFHALVAAGLVDDLANGRFRVKGLDAERKRRQKSARKGAVARWRNANASANAERTQSGRSPSGMPRRDKTRKNVVKNDGATDNSAPPSS